MPKSAAIYATQGGGKVVWAANDGRYIFIEKPDCPGLDVGDFMPEEWGTTGPINVSDCQRNSGFASRPRRRRARHLPPVDPETSAVFNEIDDDTGSKRARSRPRKNVPSKGY